MYSRYSGYKPFEPMNNRLSNSVESAPPAFIAPELEPEPQPQPQSFVPPVAAAAPVMQKGLLESLFGGGQGRGRRNHQGGGFGLENFGGIADLLRSGGGGIARLLQNFSIDWDAGDILMVLILLFMSLESDDDEILILLALILVMGF